MKYKNVYTKEIKTREDLAKEYEENKWMFVTEMTLDEYIDSLIEEELIEEVEA